MTAAWLCLAVVLGADGLGADEPLPGPQGQRWSAVGARTVGEGGNALEAGLGWPGLSVGYARGVSSRVELGGRLGLNWSLQGLVTRPLAGLTVQGLLRVKLVDGDVASFAITFEPGPLFAVERSGNGLVGLSLPVGVQLGVAVSSALGLGLTFDAPLWLQFGAGGGLNVPLLPGLGVEYFITSALPVFFRVRMGPTVRPAGTVELAFDARLGVAWRF